MSDKPGTGMPWAGLAIVVALVSGTLLPQGVFETLRPAERERVQASAGAGLEIDARLWEDPFVAARRHEAERIGRCRPQDSCPEGVPETLRKDRSVAAFRGTLDL